MLPEKRKLGSNLAKIRTKYPITPTDNSRALQVHSSVLRRECSCVDVDRQYTKVIDRDVKDKEFSNQKKE